MELLLILILILIVFFPNIKNIENFTSSVVDPDLNKDIKISGNLNIPSKKSSEGNLNAQSSIYANKICIGEDNVDKDNFDLNNCILRTDIINVKKEPNYDKNINHGIKLCIGKTCLKKEQILQLHAMSRDSQQINLNAKCYDNDLNCGIISHYKNPQNKIKQAFDKLEQIRLKSRIHSNWGSGTLNHFGGHQQCHDDYALVPRRNNDSVYVPQSGAYGISHIRRHCR